MTKATRSLKARNKGRFVGVPYDMVMSEQYKKLRAPEVKLLQDILIQFNGRNNGMLSACHTLMRGRGWNSASLYRAFSILQHTGFIVVTRQGWKQRGKPTLIAVTWAGIDEPPAGIVYDNGIQPNTTPLNYWCKVKDAWKHRPTVKDQKNISTTQ